ncbi:MAG: cell wall protein [Myxococcaceae bacterium]|nr:cell wall protein [Myxococcaceae bacterium]
MSFEKALREMIRRELAAQLGSIQKSVVQLERGLVSLEGLRDVTERLAPLLGQRGRMAVLRQAPPPPPPQPQPQPQPQPPARRGAAPARKAVAAPPAPKAKAAAANACAVIGCKRPRRSKGYCSAHYQKLRLLIRTGRRPADWKDDAPPHSARDVKLPRGRAAAKERKAAPATPKEPPKPKAWVRKKGGTGMVSLH